MFNSMFNELKDVKYQITYFKSFKSFIVTSYNVKYFKEIKRFEKQMFI